MNSESIKNNDPIQLKQMIIFLKAELKKYEHIVKQYEDGYHYSIIESLRQENAQLLTEKNDLSKKLSTMQRKKYTIPLDPLRKTTTESMSINKQLNVLMETLKNNATTDQNRYRNYEQKISSIHNKLGVQKSTTEQLESRLFDLIQKSTNNVHTQIEKLRQANDEQRLQFEEMRRFLVMEVSEKNNTIEKLQREIVELKEEKELSENQIATLNSMDESTMASKKLLQLEHQIIEVLIKSLDYEEKLDAKLAVINDLENKLDALTVEIVDIKSDEDHSK